MKSCGELSGKNILFAYFTKALTCGSKLQFRVDSEVVTYFCDWFWR